MADLRHRVRSAKIQWNHARVAGLHHRVLERRAGAAPSSGNGGDLGDHHATCLHAARPGAAADAAGSFASGSLPEHLDSKAGGLRLTRSEVNAIRDSRFAVRGPRFATGPRIPAVEVTKRTVSTV